MSGFYDVENLPRFNVNNPQTYVQQGVQNLRAYQSNMIGPMNPVHTVVLPETTTLANPYELSFDQALNANQYRFNSPTNTGAFLYGGSGPLISVSSLKRYYVCLAPNTFLNGTTNENTRQADFAVAENYGFANLSDPARADTDRSITVQVPKYFFLAATFIIGRGTEILFMFQKEDGTFEPFYLARNMLDFMGPEGFPGPTSSAYTDQLGQTTRRVVFSPITTSAGVAWV
jgi:hypothetical protein